MAELVGLGILLLVATVVAIGLLAFVVARDSVTPPRRTAGYAVAYGLALDPGDQGYEFDSWTLDRPDGAQLPVWEIRGGGSGPTTVLVHGWGQSRIDMLTRLGTWHPFADRVALYDLRGHGESRGGARSGRSRLGAGEEHDLLALLDRLGGGPFHLVGHAMGAGIALAAAAEAGERVAGVVAYAPSLDFHESLRRQLAVHHLPARPITDVAMLGLQWMGVRHRDPLADAARVPAPLLVVHGADDPISPPEHGRRVAEAAPCGAILLIEGAGHLDAHLHDAEAHDRAVRAHLGQAAIG